jgi:hypothetical protein
MKTKIKITPENSTETGIVLALLALIIGFYAGHRYCFFVAVAILLITLIFPFILKPLAYCWFGLSRLLGWITSRIILITLFYTLVTATGLIRRIMGKDTLQLNAFKKNKKTAFKDRNHLFAAHDLTYTF